MDALSEAASAASATQDTAEAKAEPVGAKETEPASAPPETKSEIKSEAASAEKIAPGGAAEGLSQDEPSTQSAHGQKGGADAGAAQNCVTAPEGAAADCKVEPKVESAATGGGGGEVGGEPGGGAAKADAEEREMELTSHENGLKGSWFACMVRQHRICPLNARARAQHALAHACFSSRRGDRASRRAGERHGGPEDVQRALHG